MIDEIKKKIGRVISQRTNPNADKMENALEKLK
jgi:hypothetical protein